MSSIYGSLFEQLEPKKYDKSRPMNPMLLEMGLAWEDMLEDGLKDRMRAVAGEDIERPGELQTVTGIYYNPDLLIYHSDGRIRLGEIKLTWMSARDMPTEVDYALPKKFRKYEVQILSYLYWLGLTDARLYIFFVNGEYAWMKKKTGAQAAVKSDVAVGPELRCYDITYSTQEIEENWAMLERHGKTVGLLDANGYALPHVEHP